LTRQPDASPYQVGNRSWNNRVTTKRLNSRFTELWSIRKSIWKTNYVDSWNVSLYIVPRLFYLEWYILILKSIMGPIIFINNLNLKIDGPSMGYRGKEIGTYRKTW